MEAKTKQIKEDILITSYEAKACHIGSALSCVDILVDLFYNKQIKPEQFVFSKASGVATYYAILTDLGYFPKEKMVEYLQKYPLPSVEVPGIVHSVGSMGHGLPVAVGMALGDKGRDIYTLLSDGECQEGSTYEAVLFAGHHKLENLHVIVDNNKLQAGGATKDILDLTDTFEFMKKHLPHCEIVDTIKGAGIDFMEGDYHWHYQNLTPELLEDALCQI